MRRRAGIRGPVAGCFTGARLCGVLALAYCALSPSAARANGAFPDSLAVLLAPDLSHRLILGTNFGLVVSEDDGVTWRWICEKAIASNAFLYQLGPAPTHKIFALGFDGLFTSSDLGCSWRQVHGRLDLLFVNDYFPDPIDDQHVLLIGQPTTATTSDVLYRSIDGGDTFETLLYTAPPRTRIDTVENARSDPRIIYATMSQSDPPRTLLLRSTNSGMSFEVLDRTDASEPRDLRILSIDPADPMTVYFRAISRANGDDDALAITRDGGESIQIAFRLESRMSAFLRRSDGALIVASLDKSLISTDRGAHFQPWPRAPHLRAIAERDGALYAAGDNFRDFFALAVSRNQGATWEPLVRYDQICGVVDCPSLRATCAAPYRDLIGFFGLSCSLTGERDRGSPSDAGPGSGPPPAKKTGCGCSAADAGGANADVRALFVLGGFAAGLIHRKTARREDRIGRAQ